MTWSARRLLTILLLACNVLPHPSVAAVPESLVLILSIAKTTIVANEPVELRVRLENRSVQDVSGDFFLSPNLGRLRLLVSKEGGDFVPYVSQAFHNAAVKKAGTEPVTIKAGEGIDASFFLSFDVHRQTAVFGQPGTYEVRGSLLYDGYRQQLDSAPVTITVTEPQGVDGQALRFIQDNGLAHLLTDEAALFPPNEQKVDKLRELLAAYPQSTYAPHAQAGLNALCKAGLTTSGCPPGQSCLGDCGFDGGVVTGEIIRGTGIALGRDARVECPTFDANGDGAVTIDELVQGLNAALKGCG